MGSVPLSVALAGLPGVGVGVRAAVEALAAAPVRAVQLDLTSPDLRPRDLGRSARRDLAALLRRVELACSGFDLFIPPDHFTDPAHADRAAGACLAAADLAGELAGIASAAGGPTIHPVISLRLPAAIPAGTRDAIERSAERAGVRLANFADAGTTPATPGPLGVGLDTGETAGRGADVAAHIATLGERLAAVRWTNVLRSSPGVRCEPGDPRGGVDAPLVHAALTVSGFDGHAVIDIRGVSTSGPLRSVLERAAGVWSPEP